MTLQLHAKIILALMIGLCVHGNISTLMLLSSEIITLLSEASLMLPGKASAYIKADTIQGRSIYTHADNMQREGSQDKTTGKTLHCDAS